MNGTGQPKATPEPDILARLTPAIRSAWAVGLTTIASDCEDAATEIILLRAKVQKLETAELRMPHRPPGGCQQLGSKPAKPTEKD